MRHCRSARALTALVESAVALAAAVSSGCASGPRAEDGGISTTSSVSVTGTAPAKLGPDCKFDKPVVTGCGGAEVELRSTLAECGLPAEGDLTTEQCNVLCETFPTRGCRVYTRPGAKEKVYCDAANPCLGRLASRGRHPRVSARRAPLHLARAARMEADSVDAFRELASDLAAFGAPVALVRACRRSAQQEARHARSMARLAVRFGGSPPPPRAARAKGFRSLESLALHNEREGVVGEMMGALVAAYQSERASDPKVRGAMKAVAREELEHAALSIRIGAWARAALGPRGARKLDRERARAFNRMLATGPAGPSDCQSELGWPDRAAARALLAAVEPVIL